MAELAVKNAIEDHQIVSSAEWLAARKEQNGSFAPFPCWNLETNCRENEPVAERRGRTYVVFFVSWFNTKKDPAMVPNTKKGDLLMGER